MEEYRIAYGDDLRQKVLRAVDTHQASQARLAEIFGVSLSWVKGIVRRRRETGKAHALPHRDGRRPKLSAAQREAFQQYLAAHDDLLLRITAMAATEVSPGSELVQFVALVASPELAM